MFFKRLEKLILATKKELKAFQSGSAEYDLLYRKIACYEAVLDYIKKGSWAKRVGAVERIMYALKNGYSEAAEHYGTSICSIKSSVYQANVKIMSIIAFDVLNMIEKSNADNLTAVMQLFHFRTDVDMKGNLFPLELKAYMSSPKRIERSIEIDEIISCLTLLNSVTLWSLADKVEAVDSNIMSHILYIINSTDPDAFNEQSIYFRFIRGFMTQQELQTELQKLK